MNSGLYERDGASATARQAACANWFDGSDDERVEGIAGRETADRRSLQRRSSTGSTTSSAGRGLGGRTVVGDEVDRRALAIDLAERLVQDGGVVLREPVAEQVVRHPYTQCYAIVRHQRGGLEPGVEDVPVDFGLDAGEDLIPDVAAVMVPAYGRIVGLSETFAQRRQCSPACRENLCFSTIFSTVVENFGGRPYGRGP